RLRARDRWSDGPPLRPRALRPLLRRLAAPRRLPARDGPRDAEHGGGAPADVGGDARPEARDRGRRLRERRRDLPRVLRGRRRRGRGRPGGRRRSGLLALYRGYPWRPPGLYLAL